MRGGFIINTSDKLKELVKKRIIPADYKLLTSTEITNKCITLSNYFNDKSNLTNNNFNVICDDYELVLESKVGLISFDKAGDMWKVPLNGKFITHLKYDIKSNFYSPTENIVLKTQKQKPLTVENIKIRKEENIMTNEKKQQQQPGVPDINLSEDVLDKLNFGSTEVEKSNDFNVESLKQTPEDIEAERKKKEREAKKEAERLERDKIREAIVGDATAQNILWDYNYERGEFGAWVVKNAPKIKFATVGTPIKDLDGKYVLNKEGKENQEAKNAINAGRKPNAKYLEKEYKVTVKELKPTSVQGLIMKVPAAGIPNYTELLSKQGQYEPDKKNTDMVYQVLTKSTALAFLSMYFKGKIKASPITHDGQKLDLVIETRFRTITPKDGEGKSTQKTISSFKLQGLEGKSTILRHNWVARTYSLTKSFDEIKKSPEEKAIANQLLFGSFFKVRGNATTPPYDKLKTEYKKKITKDSDGAITSEYLDSTGISIPAWFSSKDAETIIENPKIPLGYKNEKGNYVAYVYDVLNEDKVPQFPKDQTPDVSAEFAEVRKFLEGSGLTIKDCIEKAFVKQAKPKEDAVSPVEVFRMYMKAVDDNVSSSDHSNIKEHTNMDVTSETFESMQSLLKNSRESLKK